MTATFVVTVELEYEETPEECAEDILDALETCSFIGVSVQLQKVGAE